MKRERSFLAMGDQVVGLGGHKWVGFEQRVSRSSVGGEVWDGSCAPFQIFLIFPWKWCILVHFSYYFLQSTGIILQFGSPIVRGEGLNFDVEGLHIKLGGKNRRGGLGNPTPHFKHRYW